MDHKFAETQMSVERYTLNELLPDERTQFEEHMFDCPICADLVRQNFTVTENLKEVLLEEKQTKSAATDESVSRIGWRAWLTIPSLVPTFAAFGLGGFILLHNAGTEVMMRDPVVSQLVTLKTASRGAAQVVPIDHASLVSLLKPAMDKLSDGAFGGELDDSQGHKLMSVPRAMKADNVVIQVPTKVLPAGRYKLILHSESHPDDSQTYAFQVQ